MASFFVFEGGASTEKLLGAGAMEPTGGVLSFPTSNHITRSIKALAVTPPVSLPI
jgi:hypothetical protein